MNLNKMISAVKKKTRVYFRPFVFKAKQFYKRYKIGTEGPKKEFLLNKNIEWYGTDYGGFFLDKTLVNKKSIIFSFGIGTDISFDQSIAAMGVKNIYLFDPTPKAIAFIKEFGLPSHYKFFGYGLSSRNETTEFFLPTVEGYISGSLIHHSQLGKGERIFVELKKLSTICKELKISSPDILKIDIEGSEFEVIHDIFGDEIFPKQICIEFHSRFFEDGKTKLQDSLNLFAKHNYIMGGKSTEEEYLFIRGY